MYEFVPGGDLVSVIESWRKLAAPDRHPRAVAALKQITSAVAHFHKLGVVHRDLKPANVLAARDDRSGKTGSVQLKVASGDIAGALTGSARLKDLAVIAEAPSTLPLDGALDLSASLSGRLERPAIAVRSTGTALDVAGQRRSPGKSAASIATLTPIPITAQSGGRPPVPGSSP